MRPAPRHGDEYQSDERMARKLAALPTIDFAGKSVLDIGAHHGWWCRWAIDQGAAGALGLERDEVTLAAARQLAHEYPSVQFEEFHGGLDWRTFGTFDLVLCMSMYHHAFGLSGDHDRLWAWLHAQTADTGVLIWESPMDTGRETPRKAARSFAPLYTPHAILTAARRYFDVTIHGPAGHDRSRTILVCRPLPRDNPEGIGGSDALVSAPGRSGHAGNGGRAGLHADPGDAQCATRDPVRLESAAPRDRDSNGAAAERALLAGDGERDRGARDSGGRPQLQPALHRAHGAGSAPGHDR